MGLACREHLVKKVIEYADMAKGGLVSVRLNPMADSQHCDYCEGKGLFVVMYEYTPVPEASYGTVDVE
jgi:hypothetical protein